MITRTLAYFLSDFTQKWTQKIFHCLHLGIAYVYHDDHLSIFFDKIRRKATRFLVLRAAPRWNTRRILFHFKPKGIGFSPYLRIELIHFSSYLRWFPDHLFSTHSLRKSNQHDRRNCRKWFSFDRGSLHISSFE